MLTGKGFAKVYNLSGGIRAWNSETAFGGEEQGLEYFKGDESADQTLVVAYSLEEGLRDFYMSMIPKVQTNDAKDLFKALSEIEVKHQDRIFMEYTRITKKSITREEFENSMVVSAAEGGLTTAEYMNLFQVDWNSANDIIGVAMSIEAQALDLYLRAADISCDPQGKTALLQIASEERTHLNQLGDLMERN
jgi:rubrerythrin